MTALATSEAEGLTRGLKMLANPNRLRILARLLDGEMSVGAIEEELGIRQPSLSRELANLRDGGAITARRESKVVFYALTSSEIENLLRRVLGEAAGQQRIRTKTRTDFDPRPKFRFQPKPAPELHKQGVSS